MIENLVIVESPAKAKTIEKFLGKDFRVISSFGHIRDLAKKNLGINIEKDFDPIYEIPKEKTKVVSELRKAASEAKNIWIASDEDREGEAIAWHLAGVLKLDLAHYKKNRFSRDHKRCHLKCDRESPHHRHESCKLPAGKKDSRQACRF